MSVLSQFGTGIKSIQYGTISAAGAATSGTATITSVNTAKTVLVHLGERGTAADIASMSNTITLTNATTVTMNRSASTDAITVSFVAVEFN